MNDFNDFLMACAVIVGQQNILTDEDATLPYVTDQRKRFIGKTRAVIQPKTSHEVAQIVSLCAQHHIPIVPQGGNTGLVLGSIPDTSGKAIVLSLKRLQQIREIDLINNTITAEAGCILETIQHYAATHQRLFPLSLASEGSCTIGGNLSTNAGGTAVLHYGNMRELCLGIEFVTAQGELVSELTGLRKNNTGYDLRHLLIGAEGTLGIITAAVLKLFPRPNYYLTAMIALSDLSQVLSLLSLAQAQCHTQLTTFEVMSSRCMDLVKKHFPALQQPFTSSHAQYVLIELSEYESEAHGQLLLENLITSALNQSIIEDAVLATTLAQSQNLWALRECISEAQSKEGKNIKHDIAIPISSIAEFVQTTNTLLDHAYSGCRPVVFGHVGDGNLHYNISPPETMSYKDFLKEQSQVNRLVYDSVYRFNGTISAEHGIGTLKREELTKQKSSASIHLMKQIKQAMDPDHILNPGKIL